MEQSDTCAAHRRDAGPVATTLPYDNANPVHMDSTNVDALIAWLEGVQRGVATNKHYALSRDAEPVMHYYEGMHDAYGFVLNRLRAIRLTVISDGGDSRLEAKDAE